MKAVSLKTYDELAAYLRMKINNFPILSYIVFKKYYKERAYEMNFEILLKNQETIISLNKSKIDESDFKKMKYILSKLVAKDVNDLNKKAIVYQYELRNDEELKDLYNTVFKGLQDIQFSDFYA